LKNQEKKEEYNMSFNFGINQIKTFSKDDIIKVNKFQIFNVGDLLGLDINDNHQTICVNSDHDDSRPSMTFFEDKAYCFGCGVTFSCIDVVMAVNICKFPEAVKWLLDHEDSLFSYEKRVVKDQIVEDKSELSSALVSIFRNNLTDDDWKYLRFDRGLSVEAIERFEIGRNKNRFTIPVYENGKLANFRMYDPDSESKMINFKRGCGIYLYGESNLIEHNKLVYCEGEFDRIILEQLEFPAVTSTGGAGSFKSEWLYLFGGKEVRIIFDNDMAGASGCEKIYNHLKDTAIVEMIDISEEFPDGYDITDLYVREGWREEEFKELIYG
jgi:DNA primase